MNASYGSLDETAVTATRPNCEESMADSGTPSGVPYD